MQDQQSESAEAARRMQAYINAHLKARITARDLARAVGYSQYHATRLFKAEMGLSPFEYIRQRRLLMAAHALRDGHPSVLSVALDFVFDSHEGFTRAFSNAFGIAPSKYASVQPEGWRVLYRCLNRRKQASEGTAVSESNQPETSVIFTQVITRPARKLILKLSKHATHYGEYCEEYGCDEHDMTTPWNVLCGIKEALYEPVGLWLPDSLRPEHAGVYAHGVEVAADYAGEIPEGFTTIDLAPCQLLVFQGEPYDDAHYERAVGACMRRIDRFNPEVYGFRYDPQAAPRMQLAPMGWRGYIEMRPIKPIKES